VSVLNTLFYPAAGWSTIERWELFVVDEGESRLPGGNVSGAVRVGATVRRATGAWTPAVHALLAHLGSRVSHVPRVHGFDERGREILDYLPGHIVDVDTELLTREQIVSVVRWTRDLHRAVVDFSHPGPWRYRPLPDATLIGHNDIAPYNICFDGDDLVGVFDWDMSGPTTPVLELAFIAWNCVPLWRDIGASLVAARLSLIASTYGDVTPVQILRAVPTRVQSIVDGIAAGAAAGDVGMVGLMVTGVPETSRRFLDDLVARIPTNERYLP
jgi:hypothetical protein